ncbi:MAG: hypothetical protein IPL52_15955 [Flavobacteriales bacterium]|nr:hypothetical protein [Flavobacteriales bacterium]
MVTRSFNGFFSTGLGTGCIAAEGVPALLGFAGMDALTAVEAERLKAVDTIGFAAEAFPVGLGVFDLPAAAFCTG